MNHEFKTRISWGLLFVLSLIAVLLLIYAAWSLEKKDTWLTEPVGVTGYKFNTYVAIDAYSTGGHSSKELKNILNDALILCDRYEAMFSRTLTSSELYRLNAGDTDTVSHEVGMLIQSGLDYARLSDGAFDITIGSVSSLWDFTAETPSVPDDGLIKDALTYVDYKNVTLTQNADTTYTVSMPKGTVLDLGAIAKGYVADRIKSFLIKNNINNAVINLGGNVLCVGNKRGDNAFNIGIKKPFSDNDYIDSLKIKDMSVVSSGNYERYFYENDTLYHHILNPSTGYPYDNDISEVTIISEKSLDGDCLSTVCFALGIDEGLKLINSLSGIEAVFIDNSGNVTYSDGFTAYR